MTNVESGLRAERSNPLESVRYYEGLEDYVNAFGVMAGGMHKGQNELESYAQDKELSSESIEQVRLFFEGAGEHEVANNVAEVQKRLRISEASDSSDNAVARSAAV